MTDVPGRSLVAVALAITTLLVAAFWVAWFADRPLVATESNTAYYVHEQSFIAADAWLALCTAAGALTLFRRRPAALFWVLAGGGAGLYLGCMDGLYDVSRNDWFGAGASGYVELAVVALTWTLSIGILIWAWRNRAALLAGS